MIAATEVVLRVRLILQDLWNNYGWRSEDLRELEVMHESSASKRSSYEFWVLGLSRSPHYPR